MTTTANGLALRDRHVPAQPALGALAIDPGQTAWTSMQDAALTQLGIKDASDGDKAVFLHQCQRTGLDPFAKQIMMIGRPEKKSEKRGSQWVDTWTTKWTIQTGIDGFRVNRARAERLAGVRGILGRPVFYDSEGNEHKAWWQAGQPAAVEITYTVRELTSAGTIDTPYTSILRYGEYVQTKEINGQRQPIAQWKTMPAHMLEKCCEADVYRKAFPQDFSGIHLDDAMPLPDPGEVAPDRQRPPVGDLRQRAAAQTVTAVVVTPEPSPAGTESPVSAPTAPPAEAPPAGEASKTAADYIAERMGSLGVENPVRTAARITGRPLASLDDLSPAEANHVMRTVRGCKTAADLDGALAEIEMRGGTK